MPLPHALPAASVSRQWPKRFPIAHQLLVLALVAGLPFFLLALFYLKAYLDTVISETQHNALDLARQISQDIDGHMEGISMLLLSLSKSISLNPAETSHNRQLFQAIKADLPAHIQDIQLNATDGSALGSASGLRFNIADRLYFQRALASSGSTMIAGNPVVSRATGAWTLAIARPVLNANGSVTAVISALLRLDWLQTMLARQKLPAQTLVGILNTEAVVLAHSSAPEHWIGRNVNHVKGIQDALQAGEGISELITSDGVLRLASYVTSKQVPWLVFVGVDSDIAFANFSRFLQFGVLISVALLLVVILLIWRMGRNILRPIQHLVFDTVRFGQGDFQHRSPVRSRSEIGDLARSFNHMAVQVEAHARSLREREEQLFVTLQSIGDAVIVTDPQGRINFINPVAQSLTGWAESEVVGRPLSEVFQIISEDTGQIVENPTERVLREGVVVGLANHTALIRRDGRQLSIEDSAAPIRDAQQQILGVVLVFHDVSAQRAAASQIQIQQELLQTMFDHLPVMLMHLNRQGQPTMVNKAWEYILGWSLHEAQTQDLLTETYPDPVERQRVRLLIEQANADWLDFRTRVRDGRVIDTTWAHVRLSDGSMISIGQDITERKNYERELAHQANHDSLTGLPNRNLLNDRLEQAIAWARRHNEMFAVLFLDLDRFKTVNDSLGHTVGDALLQALAPRLRASLRETDTLARVSGDEFVIILPELDQGKCLDTMLKTLLQTLDHSFVIEDHELFLSASIGISLYPRDGTDPQSLLKNADTALYRVKARGGRDFQYYAPAMNSWAVERLRLENDLRYALERQEMVLHYQPQVDVHSGALVGLEALLRWQHPQRGLVPPDSFIPLAEESGIIIALGEWVLRTACAQARHWHEAGLPTFTLAVNISSVQFLQQDFAESVNTILNETRLEPTRLVLEITEGALIQNTTRTHALLQTIKARGVNLAIDDFGTGYSSLTYLKTFPVDILKIDRSFVQDMTADHASAELVFAIIALARALGLRTVAEGVETAEQLALLQTQQCDEVQGYYFSRPLPEAAITALLQENKRFFEVPEH